MNYLKCSLRLCFFLIYLKHLNIELRSFLDMSSEIGYLKLQKNKPIKIKNQKIAHLSQHELFPLYG